MYYAQNNNINYISPRINGITKGLCDDRNMSQAVQMSQV